jgi:hypothetical protein
MSELGSNALLNIENIIKFLKVEKMYELVFQAEPPTYQSHEKEPKGTLSPKSEHHIQAESTIEVDVDVKVVLEGADEKVGAV